MSLWLSSFQTNFDQRLTSTLIQTSTVSIYKYYNNLFIVQYYLPPPNMVGKDFLRDVFQGKKRLMKKKQVDYIHVTHWDELSVKSLFKDFKDDTEFMMYF